MKQLAIGTTAEYDLNTAGAPGIIVRLDATATFWADSGVPHQIVVSTKIGGIGGAALTVGATVTVQYEIGSGVGTNTRPIDSHTAVVTSASAGVILIQSETITMTAIDDTLEVYIYSNNGGDTGVSVVATVMDVDAYDDGVNVWHVAKTGADTNGGHSAQQALLTIMAAEAAAAAGDTINIHPGTYVENVDLDTNNKGLTLQGGGRGNTIIAPATGDGVLLGDYDTLRDLTITALEVHGGVLADGGVAVNSDDTVNETTNHVLIERCVMIGGNTGLAVEGGFGGLIRDCVIEGSVHGVKLQAQDMVVENCRIKATVDDVGNNTEAFDVVAVFETGNVVFKNCHIRVNRGGESVDITGDTYGVKPFDGVYNTLYADCVFKTRVASSGNTTGDVISINQQGTDNMISVVDCIMLIRSDSTGDSYDLSCPSGGNLLVANTFYTAANGPITHMNTGWSQELARGGIRNRI